MLLPALSSILRSMARQDREIAMLRTVEAIRMYGASHGGRLPQRLADITEVPVPEDPVTGQALVYELKGDVAVLDGPAIQGTSRKDTAVRYEIRFAPKDAPKTATKGN
jgi:hypothetical protein